MSSAPPIHPCCPGPWPDSTSPPPPHGPCSPPSKVVARSHWQSKDHTPPSLTVPSGELHESQERRGGHVSGSILGWGKAVGVLPCLGITVVPSVGNLVMVSCLPLIQCLTAPVVVRDCGPLGCCPSAMGWHSGPVGSGD